MRWQFSIFELLELLFVLGVNLAICRLAGEEPGAALVFAILSGGTTGVYLAYRWCRKSEDLLRFACLAAVGIAAFDTGSFSIWSTIRTIATVREFDWSAEWLLVLLLICWSGLLSAGVAFVAIWAIELVRFTWDYIRSPAR